MSCKYTLNWTASLSIDTNTYVLQRFYGIIFERKLRQIFRRLKRNLPDPIRAIGLISGILLCYWYYNFIEWTYNLCVSTCMSHLSIICAVNALLSGLSVEKYCFRFSFINPRISHKRLYPRLLNDCRISVCKMEM